MFRYLPFIFKNSLRNRRRSVLTILSIALSLCLLSLLMALYQGFFLKESTPESSLRVVVRNRVSLARPLPLYYGAKIKAIPGVREVSASSWFGGVWREPKDFFPRFAADVNTWATVYPEYTIAPDQLKAWKSERTACIVGRELAEKYNFKLGDRITLKGDIYPVTLDLNVRGIYDFDGNNSSLYFNREYLTEALGASNPRSAMVGTFTVLLENAAVVPQVTQTIDQMFRNSDLQTKSETEKAFQLSFVSFLGNVKMFLMSICAAVTFTILLVSGNTMAMSVRERVREIGLLKTLGFTPSAVLVIMLGEAVTIALLGGLVGTGLAAFMAFGVRQAPTFFTAVKQLSVGPDVVAVSLAVAAVIGLVSAFIPAWNASRKQILEALKYTG